MFIYKKKWKKIFNTLIQCHTNSSHNFKGKFHFFHPIKFLYPSTSLTGKNSIYLPVPLTFRNLA